MDCADVQYNADIPFEHRPAPGFYDTTEEAAKVFAAPIGSTLRAAEGKRAQEIEEQEEKRKKRKGNDDGGKSNQTQQFVAAREAQIKKLKEQEQVIRRRKLNLPTPQVGEKELEDIVKIGQAGETARELVGEADGATGRLLGEYEGLNKAAMARTPRTAPTSKSLYENLERVADV
jgi:pre-mRNA-splicing factor CDC5/CEF1